MKILSCTPNVEIASASRAHALDTQFRGWTADFKADSNLPVMGNTPYRQRPKEASPPT